MTNEACRSFLMLQISRMGERGLGAMNEGVRNETDSSENVAPFSNIHRNFHCEDRVCDEAGWGCLDGDFRWDDRF